MRRRWVFVAFIIALVPAGLHCDPTAGLQGGEPEASTQNEAGTMEGGGADGPDASCKETDAGCPEDIVKLSAGTDLACVVRREGTVYCWGSNEYAQLGVQPGPSEGVTSEGIHYRSRPTKIPTLTNVVDVSAGEHYACALTSDGTVSCWGANADNRLGHSTMLDVTCTPPDAGMGVPCNAEPRKVDGLDGIRVVGVSAGANAACVVGADKNVYCWGRNESGQAGKDPPGGPLAAAMKIASSGLDAHARSVSAAFTTRACALSDLGSLWCWGHNIQARIGAPSGTLTSAIPVQVTTSAGALSNVSAFVLVAAGGCAQTPTGIYCWGSNLWGEHANGDWDESFHDKAELASTLPSGATLLEGGRYAGAYARRTDMFGWGPSALGEIGNGATTGGGTTTAQPCGYTGGKANCIGTAQTVANLKDVVQISGGVSYVIGRKADGTVWAWGQNDVGQLGHAPNGAGSNDRPCTGYGITVPCNPAPSQVAGL